MKREEKKPHPQPLSLPRRGKGEVFLLSVSCLFLLFLPSISFASSWQGFGPVEARIQNPLYLQSLGLTPQRAQTLSKKDLQLQVNSSYSNMFELADDGGNKLFFDMELWRIDLGLMYGLRDDFEIGAQLPFYHTWGGFLDGFIQKFHSAFGLPNGGRENYPNNDFHYYLKRNGVEIFDHPRQAFSVGDFKISLKNRVIDEGKYRPVVSWFSEFKFPTGDEDGGLSDGKFDFGLGVALQKSIWRFHGYANAEYLLNNGIDALENDINTQSFAYLVGVEFGILRTWSAVVQINGATPLYSGSGLDVYSGVPLDLMVGFRGEEPNFIGGSDLIWQFGFSEDVTSKGPSVDFTVFASIGIKFKDKSKRNVI